MKKNAHNVQLQLRRNTVQKRSNMLFVLVKKEHMKGFSHARCQWSFTKQGHTSGILKWDFMSNNKFK